MNIKHEHLSQTHQEISRLLPWYVNNSLAGDELKVVEVHLSTCLTCKREAVQLTKLAKAVTNDHFLASAEQASFTRLKKRIQLERDNGAGASPVRNKGFDAPVRLSGNKVNNSWRKNYISLTGWAIAATLLLALALPFNRSGNNQLNIHNTFRTLSDGQSENLKPNEIRVVFADGVDETAKSGIIAAINGQFAGLATPQGVYTVRLPKETAQAKVLSTIAQLRQDRRVIFAEPAYALLSATQPGE